MHPFRNLLLISLGRASSFEKDPTPKNWELVFYMAKMQSLLGILYEGIMRLPESQMPPKEILERWSALKDEIARIHATHEAHVAELEEIMGRLGLSGCILKGTGLSHLYPKPERRICGDIDLWVKGNRDKVIAAFRDGGYPVHDIIYQESKADIFDDTVVEVHFHPCKMYNPFTNARMQRWFEKESPIKDGNPLTYPGARFNAVFCMAHMYRHYLEGGLGMRQLLDYYYILLNLAPSDRGPAMKTLKRLGMKRFTASVMAAVKYNFGIEDEYLLCPPDNVHGKTLVRDMIRMGNFGVMDSRNYEKEGETPLKRFMRKNRRVFSNFKDYPREVFWSPFARLSQFVWRRVKGYI